MATNDPPCSHICGLLGGASGHRLHPFLHGLELGHLAVRKPLGVEEMRELLATLNNMREQALFVMQDGPFSDVMCDAAGLKLEEAFVALDEAYCLQRKHASSMGVEV